MIWTRLAPRPLIAGGGMEPMAVEVEWLVAEDEGLRSVVQRGTSWAEADWAHSLHVEVAGLRADRWYWYAFRLAGEQSAVGRARTLPAGGAPVERFRIAAASCQNYENGYWAAWRQVAKDAPDLVLHLGDYIYEFALREGAVRPHVGGACGTLEDYRQRYAQYRLDPQLQAAHAACPWFMVWDDHEVDNDYAGLAPADDAPRAKFARRRAAAYRAYYEHLPLRARARPQAQDGGMNLHTRADIGALLRLHMLDERQYRDDQPCATPQRGGGQLLSWTECPQRLAPARQMLGPAQEQWLFDGLRGHGARWNVLGQQLLMAQLDQKPGPARAFWSDGWDAYSAARVRLFEVLGSTGVSDTVVLGGDIHSFWATALKADFEDPDSRTIASEFVGTSISSRGVPQDLFAKMLPDNPHVKFFDARWRGYLRCEVTPQLWRTEMMAVRDVADPASAVEVLKTFVVEPGNPGPQEA